MHPPAYQVHLWCVQELFAIPSTLINVQVPASLREFVLKGVQPSKAHADSIRGRSGAHNDRLEQGSRDGQASGMLQHKQQSWAPVM